MDIPLKDLGILELESFCKCSFLVNLLGDMADQFDKWNAYSESFRTPEFIWHRRNTCPQTAEFS